MPENRIGKARRLNTAPAKGVDESGKTVDVGVGGIEGDALKVITEYGNLLREVVTQLKINNKILNEVHDLNVNEEDIKL